MKDMKKCFRQKLYDLNDMLYVQIHVNPHFNFSRKAKYHIMEHRGKSLLPSRIFQKLKRKYDYRSN